MARSQISIRCVASLLLGGALWLLPVGAEAEAFVVSTGAVSAEVPAERLASVRAVFENALRQGGSVVVDPASRKEFLSAEFVAALSVQKTAEGWSLSARVSRVRLDRWSAHAQVHIEGDDPKALDEAAARLAGDVELAAKTAPPRDRSQPQRG